MPPPAPPRRPQPLRPKPLHRRLRDFVRYRSRPLRGWLRALVLGPALRRAARRSRGARVHVGSGHERLPGWFQVDLQGLPEVDLRMDARRALGLFRDARAVYAEHFLEHLAPEAALDFLVAARRALAPDGRLRLSTPNLDWVWTFVYRPDADPETRVLAGIHANRSFYGWEHRFLWNRPLLTRALAAAGFVDLRWHAWGESDDPVLCGIERHEPYPDRPEVPHALIVEAAPGEERPAELAAFRELLERELLAFRRT